MCSGTPKEKDVRLIENYGEVSRRLWLFRFIITIISRVRQYFNTLNKMRGPKLLVDLLREMSAKDGGELLEPPEYVTDQKRQKRRHHMDLLEDAG